MKIRNSSRITAIVLALMMIVPLISVPAFAVDTKVDGTKATPILSEDFESYEDGAAAAGNGLLSGPSNAIITTLDGSKVIKYDMTPATTNEAGTMFIKSSQTARDTWYVANVDPSSWDLTEDEASETASGTVVIGSTTYYFQNAVLNTDNATTACDLYADEACTEKFAAYTYHFCTAQVRNAIQGQTNIAKPSWVGGAMTGTTFVVSIDYYFASGIANKTFDVRLDNQNGKSVEIGSIKTTAAGVSFSLHNDMTDKLYNPGYTVAKDEWFTLTAILEAGDGMYSTTVYINGKLAGYGTSTKTGTFSGTKNGLNLGHVARGSAVSSYYGNYYVDNVAIYTTKDVVPTDWEQFDPNKLTAEDFENSALGTTLPGTIAYGGDTKEIVSFNGSKMLKLDFGASGNLDKPVTLQGCAVSDGIIEISTDFYIPAGVNYQFQGQISSLASADGSLTAGGEVAATKLAPTWVDLYFLQVVDGVAKIRTFGDGKQDKVIYSDAIPTGTQFTLSTYINLATGETTYALDGKVICTSYLFRTVNSVQYYLSNIQIAAGKILVGKLNKLTTSGMSAYNGDLYLDNIKVTKVDSVPKPTIGSVSYDFENETVGEAVPSLTSKPGVNPATAVYADQYIGSKAISISMLGATEATELTVPFIVLNARSYDLTVESDSFTAPEGDLTLEWLEANTTYTGSISGTNDKPIYYVYVPSENKAYVYNNNGNKATADNIGGFKLETIEISDANYNGMYRAMCGGLDANIDKNLRLAHPALGLAGTYVLSADYFIANDAAGQIQSQVYNGGKWMDLYRINLETGRFHALNGMAAGDDGQMLLVDQWNTVTMIVTVAEDLTWSADIYLNGVYCFTKEHATAFSADAWILAKIAKPNIETVQQLAGYVYVDNVKVNAEEYDESKVSTIDASKVMGFDIDGKTNIVNVSNSTELKLYATDVVAYGEDFLTSRVLYNIVATADQASIRLVGRPGLRFATLVDASAMIRLDDMIAAGQIKSYNFGTLIAPTDYISEEKALTFENFTEDVDMLDVEATVGAYYDVDEDVWTTHFAGSIVDIKEANVDRAFTGRGYFQVTLANGEVITYYSATTKSISVKDQAQATIDAGVYATDSAEYGILVGFAGEQ
ncbi:MAG: hypothetical protein IJW29_09245 [Clostridia bacterium]|nr:hypothetical protein [Clostridia bacterium]